MSLISQGVYSEFTTMDNQSHLSSQDSLLCQKSYAECADSICVCEILGQNPLSILRYSLGITPACYQPSCLTMELLMRVFFPKPGLPALYDPRAFLLNRWQMYNHNACSNVQQFHHNYDKITAKRLSDIFDIGQL